MRVGQNPGKFVSAVTSPERVTVAIVNYLPSLSGYYAQGLNVLQACLQSLADNTGPKHDLLVFDNGSCEEVRAFLTELQCEGRIQYLMLSANNLGKGGAWNIIFASGPGEIIAYADSDVLFRPGWLEQSLDLLDGYPQVGMVTSRPLRTDLALSQATIDWAERSAAVEIERDQLIPWEVFAEFDRTLGQTEEQISARYHATHDLRLRHSGLEAYVGASHFQFVAQRAALAPFFPIPMNRPMGEVRALDQLVNGAGLLRLCTTEALVTHMGNTMELPASAGTRERSTEGVVRRISEIPLIRRLLLSLYDRIFRWYFARS